jgi:hypothetical protein
MSGCGGASAEADERRGGPVDVPDPVQQATPAPQRPRVGQVSDRLLHQGAQPGLEVVVVAFAGVRWSLVRRSPIGACQRARTLAVPRNPRSTRAVTPVASRAARTPETSSNSCSWQLPGQPPSHHSRSPWMVDSATPWAMWVRRLASYRTFWLAHPPGRCTRVASPSTHTASPTSVISASRSRRSWRVATNVPSGWHSPSAANSPSSRSRLSPTSVLQIPTIRARVGRTARPAPPHPGRPAGPPAAAAGCRPGHRGGLGTGARGARQASAAPRWAETSVGGMTTETGPPGRRENPPMVRSPLIARIRHHGHPHSIWSATAILSVTSHPIWLRRHLAWGPDARHQRPGGTAPLPRPRGSRPTADRPR